MALVPCRTTIGTTGSFVRGRDPPTPVIIEKKRLDRRDGFRYAVANAIRTVNVKGFLVVGIVTDPYSGVVGCSRDRLDDPNGIRRRLFEKFFREGVVHDFSQMVFTGAGHFFGCFHPFCGYRPPILLLWPVRLRK